MYRGFNINYLRESFGIGYETRGLQVQEPIKKKLKESFLRQIIKQDNSLEASLIMDTWFPVEAYDIFLSHSALSLIGIKLKPYIVNCFRNPKSISTMRA